MQAPAGRWGLFLLYKKVNEVAIKKAKTKKPTATQRERKRVRQFISRAEKRGYFFDEEFKASLKSAKYQTLKSYTPEKLYKKAEYLILRNTEQYGAGEIISGTAGRRLERKIATEKGRITQLANYQKKHGGQLYIGSDNRLHYTRDPEVAIKATRENIRKRVDQTRSEADKIKERQQEEIRNRIDEAVNAMDSSTVKEELAEYGDEEYESQESVYADEYEVSEINTRELNKEDALSTIKSIDSMLSDVYYDRYDLKYEQRELIAEIEWKLDNDKYITEEDLSKLRNIYDYTYGYTRNIDYDSYMNEPIEPEQGYTIRDLTEEDYEVYGRVLEMVQTTEGKGAEILDKIIANAISKFGEEEVIKSFAEMNEDDIADMQFAINYETDINGGRVFSKIAKRLYSVTGARISNEMNREIGMAMDTM